MASLIILKDTAGSRSLHEAIKYREAGAGERQWALKSSADLAEDPGSVLSPHSGSQPFTISVPGSCLCVVYLIHAPRHIMHCGPEKTKGWTARTYITLPNIWMHHWGVVCSNPLPLHLIPQKLRNLFFLCKPEIGFPCNASLVLLTLNV